MCMKCYRNFIGCFIPAEIFCFNFFHHKKTLKMLAETKNISTFALSKNK